jgi:hypothetical protein
VNWSDFVAACGFGHAAPVASPRRRRLPAARNAIGTAADIAYHNGVHRRSKTKTPTVLLLAVLLSLLFSNSEGVRLLPFSENGYSTDGNGVSAEHPASGYSENVLRIFSWKQSGGIDDASQITFLPEAAHIPGASDIFAARDPRALDRAEIGAHSTPFFRGSFKRGPPSI